jgi:ketosteroid isomerase-like protein
MNRTGEHRERPEQRILRMSRDEHADSSSEVELRHRIEALAQAIRDKDVDRLMKFYAADVVVFDLRPPLDARGTAAYRRNFERWFASFAGPIGFELKDLRLASSGGTAFCNYLGHVKGTRPGDRKADYWVRGTTCFEHRDGHWLVTHEHISMPTTM